MVVIGVAKDRLKISCSLPSFSSSKSMHGVPCSSSTVRITTTLNLSRMATGSAAARSAIEKIPIAPSRRVNLPAMPQTSDTGRPASSCARHAGLVSSQTHTPPNTGSFFAVLFASFARVFVLAMPTQTGTPTSRRISSLIRRPKPARSLPTARGPSPRNASSIE